MPRWACPGAMIGTDGSCRVVTGRPRARGQNTDLTETRSTSPAAATAGPDLFRLGMRRLASGVSLITTRHAGASHGLVATSVSSLTGEPPTLLVCVNRTTTCHDPIAEAGVFCVNMLAARHREIAAQFGSSKRRAERFRDGDWTHLVTGAPVLLDCLAAFDCRVETVVPYGTHTIFIGAVEAVRLPDDAIEPLLYVDGAFRDLADPELTLAAQMRPADQPVQASR